MVHPMEHLRYVARSHGSDPVEIALQTANALAPMAADSASLVVLTRRMVEHHPQAGPLWWMCSSALTAIDAYDTLVDNCAALRDDDTARHVVDALPDEGVVTTIGWNGYVIDALVRHGSCTALVVDSLGDGQGALRLFDRTSVAAELVAPEGAGAAAQHSDVIIIGAYACGRDMVMVPGGALALAAVGYVSQVPVWLIAGTGTRLPDALWDHAVNGARSHADPWANDVDIVSLSLFSHVIGPRGKVEAKPTALLPECSVAPELLQRSAF